MVWFLITKYDAHDMLSCDIVSFDMGPYGAVCFVLPCGIVSFGMVPYGTVQCDIPPYGILSFGMVLCSTVSAHKIGHARNFTTFLEIPPHCA